MASSAVLDVDALLAPIPGDNPAGKPAPFALWNTLEAARKEFMPDPEDPSAPPMPRNADWSGISKLVRDTLTGTSKDLGLAIRLCEALVKQHGFAGLRDGFRLLQRMVEECWDRVYPTPDTEDGEGMEVRAAPFEWIADAEKASMFPLTVRGVPILLLGSQPFSGGDYQASARGKGPIPSEDLSRLVLIKPDVVADLDECVAAFKALDATLTEKLGGDAPGLSAVGQALEECQTALRRFAPAAAAAPAEAPADSNGTPSAPAVGGSGGGGGVGAITTRQDAYKAIEQIASVLERIEPHSPIPYLLRRAVQLGSLPFHLLVRELVRHSDTLETIEREFGIKKPEEAENSSTSSSSKSSSSW